MKKSERERLDDLMDEYLSEDSEMDLLECIELDQLMDKAMEVGETGSGSIPSPDL